MSYAVSAFQRSSIGASELLQDTTSDLAQPADRTASTMAMDLAEDPHPFHRYQPLRPQRAPLMRQYGPNMSVETAFDLNYAPELARLVMLHGETSFRRRDGSLLVHEAAQQGNVAALRILLGRGDSTEHENALGQTPLIIAAAHGQTDTVSALAGFLPNVNHQDHQGNTALMVACQLGDATMVDSLLRMGADITLRNQMNQSAADIARANHHPAILFKLRSFQMQ